MADTAYKRVDLRDRVAPQDPSGWNVRGNASLDGFDFYAICRAQDYLLGGFRPVMTYHTGGLTGGWLVADGDPSVTTYPDDSTWRVMQRCISWVTPGSDLECRALALPSGSEATSDTVTGDVRWTVYYETDANTDSTATKAAAIVGSDEAHGAVGTSDSWDWHHLQHVWLGIYRPDTPGYMLPVKRAKWSESVDATTTLEVRGGARVISAAVTELPSYHSRAHDTDASTAHAATLEALPADVSGPRESQADGATYEERRYGTHALLDVAERQTTLLGPTIWQWSSHTEGETEPGDAEADPITNATTAAQSVCDSAVSSWSADEPGFGLPCYYAERDHEVGTLPHSSVAPVRVRVYHDTTGGGTARVQTTARSWVDVDLPATTGYEWTTTTAHLECDPAPDVVRANGMVLYWADSGGSVSLRYIVVTWGHA